MCLRHPPKPQLPTDVLADGLTREQWEQAFEQKRAEIEAKELAAAPDRRIRPARPAAT
jgi:hypothetical protein